MFHVLCHITQKLLTFQILQSSVKGDYKISLILKMVIEFINIKNKEDQKFYLDNNSFLPVQIFLKQSFVKSFDRQEYSSFILQATSVEIMYHWCLVKFK